MALPISIDPSLSSGKSWDYPLVPTLPYEADRVDRDCHHPDIYYMQNMEGQPLFCGLCLLMNGYQAELPMKLHFGKRTLAENGNPQTAGGFLSHLHLALGLKPPQEGESLHKFRQRRKRKRNTLAREQYTSPAWMLYPVASALWKLMGYQPPLAIVLVRAVEGASERDIADQLDLSILNVNIRMVKAIRTTMGYLPRDSEERAPTEYTAGGTDNSLAEVDGAGEQGTSSLESPR